MFFVASLHVGRSWAKLC